MAKHIQEYASEFTVCDLNQEAAVDILEDGGIWAETPSKCAENKDVLFILKNHPSSRFDDRLLIKKLLDSWETT